ncbi:MAG TPA: DUF1016 N-terminal domain-containing protein [Candidatus Omnitrophota bacterium]|nr:DUF1016 N-terminal domain-containing protein [Candidatus Omnitrophota bacterium]
MPTAIAENQYTVILNDISSIYQEADAKLQKARNQILTQAYWAIGRRIVTEEQENKFRANYGEQLMERLSKDLSARHGKGFSTRNLAYMRKFYVTFPILQTSAELPWSTYQVLSTVKDKEDREHLLEEAVRKNWSVRELKETIQKEDIDTQPVDFKELGEQRTASSEQPLKEQRGLLYTYKIRMCPVEGKTGLVPLVDCGFTVLRDVELEGFKSAREGMLVEWDGKKFEESKAKETQLYTFKATLERVIDGDTLLCVIDCGFGTWVRQKLRLRGIDCAELVTQKGQAAKAFVESELKGKALVIKTYKTDKYDRYLADIFYAPAKTSPEETATEGAFLNQQLLDKDLAVRVD